MRTNRNPSATTVKIQIKASTAVIRVRLRSADVEPRAAPPPPPNMSDRPPPRPLCIKIPATMANMETTLITTVEYITKSRTVCQPSVGYALATVGALTATTSGK